MPKVQRKKKAVQLLVTCMAIISMIPCMPSFAMTLSERLHQQQGDTPVSTEPEVYADYATVLSEYTRLNYVSASAESATILTTENISSVLPPSAIMNDYNGRQAVLDWQENLDSVEWTFQIPETGLYSMQVEYMAGSGTTDIVRRIALDGVVPFDECQNITFLRQWQVVGSIPKNAYGDELSPTMEQAYNWQTTTVADSAGLYNAPFEFYLTAGEHRLSMDMMNSPMYIHSITFVPLEDVLPYEEVRQFYQRQGYTSVEDAACRFEAENIQYVNFGSMRMSSDNDPSVYPLSRGLVRMNVMGGDNWAQGNSTMSWTFHVDKSGLYKLMVRVKNNYQSGVPSYRRIEIDGKVPFKEWEAYGFAYGNRWRSEVLAAEGVVIIISIWMSMGTGFLTFLAGLQNMNAELYEAGMIDGIRNNFQQLIYITLPQMKPQLLFGAINAAVTAFGVFDVSVAVAGMPSTNYAAHTIVAHLYDYAFLRFEMGYASAVSVFLFFFTFLLGRWFMKIFATKE